MSPFTSSYENRYILVGIDYVSKLVEGIASPTNDHKVVMKLFKSIIFPVFGVPKIVIRWGFSLCEERAQQVIEEVWSRAQGSYALPSPNSRAGRGRQ